MLPQRIRTCVLLYRSPREYTVCALSNPEDWKFHYIIHICHTDTFSLPKHNTSVDLANNVSNSGVSELSTISSLNKFSMLARSTG